MQTDREPVPRVSSGISGLDELLQGGFVRGRMYLVAGEPGTGKTTVGFHFLEDGIANGEAVLYIHGEESADEALENAAQFGIDISEASFLDLGPDPEFFTEDPSYDLVSADDIEEERYTRTIRESIEEVQPSRVVLDPITQLKYIESSEHHYRKRLLSFMRFLKARDITVVATATTDRGTRSEIEIRSLSDGVVELVRGREGRRIEIQKHRGVGQVDGTHGLEIRSAGIEVFPRVVPEPNDTEFDPVPLKSGVSGLDKLAGGGFERGTVTFVTGPPGVGKTTTGGLYLTQAAHEGRRAVIYLFEEREETFTHRCRSLGVPIDDIREEELLSVETVDPLTMSAEEFAHAVRDKVETAGVELVMIDGFGGYTTAIQGSRDELKRDLHALTRYLSHNEVSTFVTDATHRITGIASATSSAISPIADNILFLSYVELDGSLRKVIGVLKKRAGGFERTLREFEITPEGVRIGEPMTEFRGIIQGTPQFGGRDPPGDG
jgi:circadian clock protein KaiC